MKIATISWVRNEADILEAFVRYHCTFVQNMIIVCHRCRDNSAEILRHLEEEGLPLDVRTDDGFAHRQPEILTQMLRELRESDGDWIFPLDADEFLHVPDGLTLEQILDSAPHDALLQLPWQTYVPRPDNRPDPLCIRRISHRKEHEELTWYKIAFPMALLKRHPEAVLMFGSHTAHEHDTGPSLPMHPLANLTLAHFPVRTSEQIARKAFGGWLSYLAYERFVPGGCFQWKTIFDECKGGVLPSPERLMRLASEYAGPKQLAQANEKSSPDVATTALVRDPLPCDFSLRYEIREVSPWTVLAESAEELAQQRQSVLQSEGERH